VIEEVYMTEKIITRKTGTYGRVNIVLPITAKKSMLSWVNKSGLKKAQFFRTALMIGSVQLAENLGIKENTENHFVVSDCERAQQPARR